MQQCLHFELRALAQELFDEPEVRVHMTYGSGFTYPDVWLFMHLAN